MTPDQYCQKKTSESGSSFYYSFLFLTHEKRQAITAVYTFCREADDIVDECTDPNTAETKLNWWREEIQNLFSNKPSHPVTLALSDALKIFDLQKDHFDEILNGMQMDLHITQYQTFNDLLLYCHRAAGVVGLLATEIFGYNNKDTLTFAENLGIAFQLTNIIRDIKEDALRGRVYLPQEDLIKFNVTEDDLRLTSTKDSVKKLIQFQIERTKEYYKKAFSHLPDEDRSKQRSAVIMSSIYKTILTEIEKDDFRIMEHKIKLTPLRKFWIAWKTARREKKLYR
ncbi:MAG: presqualene diphosphate synthase HpnD [Gammaproteobacteria bacterium]|nr:presqualene diphosphate synthase HpnD [Gammaproteobacteria bacterium]